jgi:signal transduction histidine kinase
MAIIEDITNWRSLEDQLRQSQRMEALGRLAGGVAHDFNNMLNVMLGDCEVLTEKMGKREVLRDKVEKIQEAATRSAGLTRQLLALMAGGTNGLELASALYAQRPELKVLYMTGYTADVVDQNGLSNMRDKLLQKPFSGRALQIKIREVLAGHRSMA